MESLAELQMKSSIMYMYKENIIQRRHPETGWILLLVLFI